MVSWFFCARIARAHLDTATGAPASGTAPLHEPEPETPDRRSALHDPISPLVAVSRFVTVLGRGPAPPRLAVFLGAVGSQPRWPPSRQRSVRLCARAPSAQQPKTLRRRGGSGSRPNKSCAHSRAVRMETPVSRSCECHRKPPPRLSPPRAALPRQVGLPARR